MSEIIPFEEEAGKEPEGDESFRLDLEGYEGPIDVLLQLARDQKVDITRLSILELAEQYLEFVRRARKLRLELAADYLVMAAWLAYLKSRLLIPVAENDDEPSGAEMAAALKFQLQRLEAMQDAGARLLARSQLGQEVFARGQPEPLRRLTHASYEATLFELLSAYVRHHVRVEATSLQIEPLGLADTFFVPLPEDGSVLPADPELRRRTADARACAGNKRRWALPRSLMSPATRAETIR